MRVLISPSGNLYGSENVLFDYVTKSKLVFDYFFVPKQSKLYIKLQKNEVPSIEYKSLYLLYTRIFILLLSNRISVIYCNEAGHLRYLNLLSRIFKSTEFIIHVRILEDCVRINSFRFPSNIRFIAVSHFIAKDIHTVSKILHDGYIFDKLRPFHLQRENPISVGIVGRITLNKGVTHLLELLKDQNQGINYNLYGHMDPKLPLLIRKQLLSDPRVFIHGFVSLNDEIYKNIDILMHLNDREPLGRIFFEALDFGVPIIGFNKGGISEIGELIEYPYLIEAFDYDVMLDSLLNFDSLFSNEVLNNARLRALKVFSITNYINQMDKLLK